MQFLKWTNRYIDNRADSIYLQASIDDRKEQLTLLLSVFIFPVATISATLATFNGEQYPRANHKILSARIL